LRVGWELPGDTMNDRRDAGARRPATEKQRRDLQRYCGKVAKDLPELRRQAAEVERQMRTSAMLEATVSGQLRRAISESGMDQRELADRTGLSPKALAEFLAGTAALDSAAIDKLATLLKHQLTPIG
jgi:ribosome-binding protein aMBF1 (putative translation factor)